MAENVRRTIDNNREPTVTPWPRERKIRTDNAVEIPEEIMALFKWPQGYKLRLTVEQNPNRLILDDPAVEPS